MIFNFRNFHLTSLIEFYVTRPSPIVLSHKKNDDSNYDFSYNVTKIGVWDSFLCKIIYGRVWGFSVSQSLVHQIKVIIFYFSKFAGSWNEFMLPINTKKCLLILGFSKIRHRGYDKSGKIWCIFYWIFAAIFSGITFLCVDDRSENDSVCLQTLLMKSRMAC